MNDDDADHQTHDAETILQSRIRERLGSLRRTARDVSVKAGLGPDAVRIILAGRSKSPRGDTLTALARELQCDVDYLLGASPTPRSTIYPVENDDGTLAGAMPMSLTAELGLEWERRGGSLLGPGRIQETNIFSLPDFDPLAQTLYKMGDASMDKVAPPGSYIHVLEFEDDNSWSLKDKDLVVIERFRSMSDTNPPIMRRQISLRLVRILETSQVYFETLSTNPSLADDVLVQGGSDRDGILDQLMVGTDGAAISLIGLALRVTRVLDGPSVESRVRHVSSLAED